MRAAARPVEPDLDIALVGVPLDLGATYRMGARHGPEGVRNASRLIRQSTRQPGLPPIGCATSPMSAMRQPFP